MSGPDKDHAERITADSRTTAQIASDTFVHLVEAGADVDPSQLLGSGGPVIRILTRVASVASATQSGRTPSAITTATTGTSTAAPATGPATGTATEAAMWPATGAASTGTATVTGSATVPRSSIAPPDGDGGTTGTSSGAKSSGSPHGFIEGQPDPISSATLERLACTGATVPVMFTESGPLDVGREQRLFTRAQRIALAARDGGCMWPGCDRPASWTEAHHINHWKADHGRTDIADGLLLCKSDHLTLHNNGWKVTRQGESYWLVPPADVDPDQTPIRLNSKSRAWKEAFRRPEHALPHGVDDQPADVAAALDLK